MAKKKKILLLSDDLRMTSGIATVSKEFVFGTMDKFHWVQLGAALKHPESGKQLILDEDVRKTTGVEDASVKIYCNTGYGNPDILRQLLNIEKPDAILHFTDPRFWRWLYEMENEVRQICPIMYYNIWDSLPDPLWNAPFYASCDLLLGISKQTYGINKRTLEKTGLAKEDWNHKYIPHGVSPLFKPLSDMDPPGTLDAARPINSPVTWAVLIPLTACRAVICAISWLNTPANSASELKCASKPL